MIRSSVSLKRMIITIFIFLGVAGCSPALNWRQVPIGSIHAMLPCKPDHAKRSQILGEHTLEITMMGCKADGALFAISFIQAKTPEQARTIMHSWKAASLSNMQAKNTIDLQNPNISQARQIVVQDQLYIQVNGADAKGKATQARLKWMVAGSQLYHWAVYTDEIKADSVEPLFEN